MFLHISKVQLQKTSIGTQDIKENEIMTEPVVKNLGGLTYPADSVKSAIKLKNGQYELIFKTGEKFTYPEQKPFDTNRENYLLNKATTGETLPEFIKPDETAPRNAEITQRTKSGLLYDDTYFNITNVMGGYFTTSEESVSHVFLDNSSGTTINLGANDSKIFPDTGSIDGGAGNKLILDNQDWGYINGRGYRSKGTKVQ